MERKSATDATRRDSVQNRAVAAHLEDSSDRDCENKAHRSESAGIVSPGGFLREGVQMMLPRQMTYVLPFLSASQPAIRDVTATPQGIPC